MSAPATKVKSPPALVGDGAEPWHRTVHGHYIWLVRRDVSQEVLARLRAGLQEPRDFIKRPDARSSSAVFRFSSFVAKEYALRTLQDRIKTLARGSRARRALFWARTLGELGVPTIRPVAMASVRWRPWQSCLISEYIAARCTIHEWIDSQHSSLQRRWILNSLAEMMARLHDAGISHGDAHLANFIVERSQPPRLVLVDMDALRPRRMSAAVAANDLKRLLDYAPGTHVEHLRFLVAYARRRQSRVRVRELLSHLQAQRRGPGPLRNAP